MDSLLHKCMSTARNNTYSLLIIFGETLECILNPKYDTSEVFLLGSVSSLLTWETGCHRKLHRCVCDVRVCVCVCVGGGVFWILMNGHRAPPSSIQDISILPYALHPLPTPLHPLAIQISTMTTAVLVCSLHCINSSTPRVPRPKYFQSVVYISVSFGHWCLSQEACKTKAQCFHLCLLGGVET